MARIARVVVPGCRHRVTQRGVRSMRIFRSRSDREEYLRLPPVEAPARCPSPEEEKIGTLSAEIAGNFSYDPSISSRSRLMSEACLGSVWMRVSILRQAYMTVVWSFLPKAWPISWREADVSARQMYIAT